MSEPIQLALIAAFTASSSSIASVVIAWFTYKRLVEAKRDGRVVAAKVAEVKETLATRSAENDVKLEDLAKVAKATHTLVNSNMSLQLIINRNLAKRLADDNPNNPRDQAAYRDAEDKLAAHMAQQGEVDQQVGTDAEKAGETSGQHLP